jgi:uncharacterized membrane protein
MSDSVTSEALVAALAQRGVIKPGVPPLPLPTRDRPWFVSTLLGVAGWFAGIFVLVFIGELFKPSGTMDFAIAAAVLLPAAFGLYAADRHNAFFDQLALALSIAGQVAATVAIASGHGSAAQVTTWVAVMQCALLVVMPNRLARYIAAFFACVAWALAIRFAWWGTEAWGGDTRYPVPLGPALTGWAVIWVPIAAISVVAIRSEAKWMAHGGRRIMRPALGGMLLALTFGTFASAPLEMLDFLWSTDSRLHTNWLAIWPLLNVTAALIAALGAFQLRNRALLGVAIAAALLHVVNFYFLLGTTLLMKSAIMLVIGALLLGLGVVLRNGRVPQGESIT